MESSHFGWGLVECLVVIWAQLLGMPPGERDPQLIKSPPATSYFYCEWAARAPGVEDAAGITGFTADPEIQAFWSAIESSILSPESSNAEPAARSALRSETLKLVLLAARHPGGLFVAGRNPRPNEPPQMPVEAAVILNLGDDQPAFLASLKTVLASKSSEPLPDDLLQAEIPFLGIRWVLHADGPRLVLATGVETLESIQTRWKQPASELAQLPAFVDSWAVAQVPEVSGVVWCNLASTRNDLQAKFDLLGMMLVGMSNTLGLGGVNTVLSVSGLEQHETVHRTHFGMMGPAEGLLAWSAGRTVTAADLAHIPADADFVAAISMDLKTMHQGLRGIVLKTTPRLLGAYDEFQKNLERELQFPLVDVFQGFDDVWTIYDAPSTGGFLFTGMVVAVPVRDPQRAELAYRRVLNIVDHGEAAEADVSQSSIQETSFLGETIQTFAPSASGELEDVDAPLLPSFCLTKQHLLFGLHPQALKAHLRMIRRAGPRFSDVIARKVPATNGEPLAVVYIDQPRIGRVVYSAFPFLAKSMADELHSQGVAIHPADIPSAMSVLPYLQEASLTVLRRPDGLMIEQRNNWPLWMTMILLPQLKDGLSRDSEQGTMAPTVQLGTAESVVPANAETPSPDPQTTEPSAVEKAARQMLPAVVRGLIPGDIDLLIPPEVFQKMAEPPDPEKAAERAEERQRRREERAARRAKRLKK